MRTLQYLMMITILFCVSGNVLGQEAVQGTLQYKPNDQNSPTGAGLVTASAVIPVPAQGVPYQVKAVISKKTLQPGEKKEQRIVFITQGEAQKSGAVFTVQDGKINASIGNINPLTEKVSLSLVYKSMPAEGGKAVFTQQKVELTQTNQ